MELKLVGKGKLGLCQLFSEGKLLSDIGSARNAKANLFLQQPILQPSISGTEASITGSTQADCSGLQCFLCSRICVH